MSCTSPTIGLLLRHTYPLSYCAEATEYHCNIANYKISPLVADPNPTPTCEYLLSAMANCSSGGK